MDSSIKFNVSANTAQFDSAMKRVGSVAMTTGDRVRSAFSGLGGLLAGGAIVAGLQSILSKMDDISDRAKRFGVSAEDIQKVGNAAEIVGTNFETVARAMDRTGVAANKAAREGGSVAEAFERVNLDPAAFAAATLQERVQMIAKAQQAANGDATKMAELFEVIGVRAAGINFAELSKEMGAVNAASSDVVERLAEANDLLTQMQQNATIFGANLLKALVIDPAQRLGGLLGGAGLSTTEDIQKAEQRRRAERGLIDSGKLQPRDPSQPWKDGQAPDFRAMPNTEAGRKAKEAELQRQRTIDQEVQRLESERKRKEKELRDTIKGLEDGQELPAVSEPRTRTASSALPQVQRTSRRGIPLAELTQIYAEQFEKIQQSGQYDFIKAAMERKLNDQFAQARQAMNASAMNDFNKGISQQALTESMRRAAQPQQPSARAETQQSDPATETTLQRVANFLEELTGKLPQPVLV